MNQADQNINKDMFDSDLIDVESLDLTDDQTWLHTIPGDSGQRLDIVTWTLTCDWPFKEDDNYVQAEKQLNNLLDSIINSDAISMPDKHKFDSRTYVRPKKRISRPSIQNIVEVPSNPPSMSPNPSLNPALNHVMNLQGTGNKFLTYNKYNSPLGPISPLLRLKTFNVDTHTENSSAVKEFALKRKSLVHDEDPQLEDFDMTLVSDASGRLSMEHTPSKPINIDLSQPAHNLHNTFNKGVTNMFDRPSLNMYQSGESLMRMSPPSLVSSLLMESSGTFNTESLESRKPAPNHDTGASAAGRDSIDPMMTSMTLSILDEKDMSTSFLSQTTYPDHDSLLDSLPPSLVTSVNSSYIVPTKSQRDSDANIFSSATFTHLEQSEKLLSARPRYQLYNSFTKPGIRNSESYTKSREEACQIDTVKVLNENSSKESTKTKSNVDMTETITLHYSNNKFEDAEKENFKKDDAFYKEMGVPKPEEQPRNSLNVTLGKQELNEIIQARQKLSLARKGLPEALPNQTDSPPVKTIQLPNQIITVPKQSMENVSELLSRRRANGFERSDEASREIPARESRDTPKRNATFKVSPRGSGMDTMVVYVKSPPAEETPPSDNNIIDINSATINLLNEGEGILQNEEWGSQERAMVGSSESTDTGTFSSSSPPDSVPETASSTNHHTQIASTPLIHKNNGMKSHLLNTTTISPIYDMVTDKSYTLTKAPSSASAMERTYDMNNTTVINSATIVKKQTAKRDILACKSSSSQDNKPPSTIKPNRTSPTGTASHGSIVPPSGLPLKSNLPTSKLRQYSSHRELSRIPGVPPPAALSRVVRVPAAGRSMVRRGVYASNPALSPTAPAPSLPYSLLQKDEPVTHSRPVLTNPPVLVRQGTETLRRASQLIAPRELRSAGCGVPVSMRNHQVPPPTTRPYSIAGAPPPRPTASRPASVPAQNQRPAPVTDQPRPTSGIDARVSALPRPSRLPAPRRTLRPPSTYTVAPSADADHY